MITFSIIVGCIILFSLISRIIGPIILNIVGLPGALIGLKSFDKKEIKYIIGSIISGIGQSYLYIAFMIYIINFSRLLIDVTGVNKYFMWTICFILLIGTIQQIRHKGKLEFNQTQKETDSYYENPQLTGLLITEIVAFIGFFAIVFYPNMIDPIWTWVDSIPFPI
ncbi:hypothetical protein [Gelidibacter mesophilus]|uniref:hypothetical protein n=1 Tax=Gelidibacter mesophilus TaxID=169050 RepID=UPI0012FB112F|nr:hypothetical protein [Gelidibacter mesophilus]